ncbi:hypothetical protein EDD15DRAFT_2367014 [Pisolithus albus]|nr:hypothetical protein EDD15DRAFT_2367014 [Pisolithus albus]
MSVCPPAMVKQSPKAKKPMIRVPPHRALLTAVDDKVDKLLALPLSVTVADVASEPQAPQDDEICEKLSHAESNQAQVSKHDMIGLADGTESSHEEQELTAMNEALYEQASPKLSHSYLYQPDFHQGKGSELTFINLNTLSFGTSGKEGQPEPGSISHSEDESLLKEPSKKRTKVTQWGLKQQKIMKVQVNLSEDEDGSATDMHVNELRQFTVYVQVWSTYPGSRKPSGKSIPATKIVSRGPFKCNMAAAFSSFKSHVAKAFPCQVSALHVSKFEWKFENQAQGAPQKKVADEAGYEALLDAVKAKHQHENVVIWLYTPVPRKDEEDWDVGTANSDEPIDCNDEVGTDFNKKACFDDMVNRVKTAKPNSSRLIL